MQFAFGSGNMFITQLQDALGAAVANPTPHKLMDLQEGNFDLQSDTKTLYGQNQFPVAVGRGKASISIKVKPARILASVWNSLFFGQTLSPGLIAVYNDTVGIAIPSTPFQITVTPPSSGTFSADMGVFDANGVEMTRVASAPATGQYAVNTGTGQYTFAAADTTKTVYINYKYTTSSAATGNKQTVNNLQMGFAPRFSADLTVEYLGKKTTFSFPSCIATKMGMPLKNEDFAIPEFDFSAFDNGAGQVMSWSTSE